MERRIAPSAKIEEAIEEVLLGGLDDADRLTELGRLGAQLVLQRAVEEEVTAFLGRARYERTETATGSRNGHRPRRVQTAEGEITVAVPQVRDTLTRFVSATIPDTKAVVRTRPLEALVIGAYVRGLSDRDIESLTREAGLGTISKTTVSTHLPRAARPLSGLPGPLARRGAPAGAHARRHLPADPARGTQGGRARGLGLHDRGRARPARRLPRPARAHRGLARPRARAHRARPAQPAARGRRRGTGADPCRRRAVARGRPPALQRASTAEHPRQAAQA